MIRVLKGARAWFGTASETAVAAAPRPVHVYGSAPGGGLGGGRLRRFEINLCTSDTHTLTRVAALAKWAGFGNEDWVRLRRREVAPGELAAGEQEPRAGELVVVVERGEGPEAPGGAATSPAGASRRSAAVQGPSGRPPCKDPASRSHMGGGGVAVDRAAAGRVMRPAGSGAGEPRRALYSNGVLHLRLASASALWPGLAEGLPFKEHHTVTLYTRGGQGLRAHPVRLVRYRQSDFRLGGVQLAARDVGVRDKEAVGLWRLPCGRLLVEAWQGQGQGPGQEPQQGQGLPPQQRPAQRSGGAAKGDARSSGTEGGSESGSGTEEEDDEEDWEAPQHRNAAPKRRQGSAGAPEGGDGRGLGDDALEDVPLHKRRRLLRTRGGAGAAPGAGGGGSEGPGQGDGAPRLGRPVPSGRALPTSSPSQAPGTHAVRLVRTTMHVRAAAVRELWPQLAEQLRGHGRGTAGKAVALHTASAQQHGVAQLVRHTVRLCFNGTSMQYSLTGAAGVLNALDVQPGGEVRLRKGPDGRICAEPAAAAAKTASASQPSQQPPPAVAVPTQPAAGEPAVAPEDVAAPAAAVPVAAAPPTGVEPSTVQALAIVRSRPSAALVATVTLPFLGGHLFPDTPSVSLLWPHLADMEVRSQEPVKLRAARPRAGAVDYTVRLVRFGEAVWRLERTQALAQQLRLGEGDEVELAAQGGGVVGVRRAGEAAEQARRTPAAPQAEQLAEGLGAKGGSGAEECYDGEVSGRSRSGAAPVASSGVHATTARRAGDAQPTACASGGRVVRHGGDQQGQGQVHGMQPKRQEQGQEQGQGQGQLEVPEASCTQESVAEVHQRHVEEQSAVRAQVHRHEPLVGQPGAQVLSLVEVQQPQPQLQRCTQQPASAGPHLPAANLTPAHLLCCVPPSVGPPPPRPDELQRCGLTFHPDVAPGVRRAMADWGAGLGGTPLHEAEPQTVQVRVLGAAQGPGADGGALVSTHRLSPAVLALRVCELLGLGEVEAWGRDLPLHAPVQEGRVERRRDEQRGGWGLWATAAVKKSHPLCVEGGYVMPAAAAERFVSLGWRDCGEGVRAELRERVGGGGSTTRVSYGWKMLAASYCMPYHAEEGRAGEEEAAPGKVATALHRGCVAYGSKCTAILMRCTRRRVPNRHGDTVACHVVYLAIRCVVACGATTPLGASVQDTCRLEGLV